VVGLQAGRDYTFVESALAAKPTHCAYRRRLYKETENSQSSWPCSAMLSGQGFRAHQMFCLCFSKGQSKYSLFVPKRTFERCNTFVDLRLLAVGRHAAMQPWCCGDGRIS